MTTQFINSLIIGVLVATFVIAIAPLLFALFLPYRGDGQLPQTVKELIARYIYGTGAILAGGIVTVAMMDEWWPALAFLAPAVGCGVLVVIRYFVAEVNANRIQNGMQRKNNRDLNE